MLLLEKKTIAKIFYRVIMESIFDDFSDRTEAVIPWDVNPEDKQKLIDRYESSGTPYVLQSDPRKNPERADPFRMTPRQRKLYVWHMAQKLADEYPAKQAEEIARREEAEKRREEKNAARIRRIIQRAREGHAEATGVLGDMDYLDVDPDETTLDYEKTETDETTDLDLTMAPIGRSKTF